MSRCCIQCIVVYFYVIFVVNLFLIVGYHLIDNCLFNSIDIFVLIDIFPSTSMRYCIIDIYYIGTVEDIVEDLK